MAFSIDRAFTFYFMRHGATDFNVRGLRCGGDVDVPLTDLGCDQALQVGKRIARLEQRIGHIVAGSLIRARQTALIVSGVLGGLPIGIDPLLNERSLGAWNGRPIAENEHSLRQGETPPGGESEAGFADRIAGALEKLRDQFDRRLLIVSSSGVGRVVNTLLGGAGRLAVANGEVVEFSCVPAPAGGYALRVHRPHQAG